MLWNSVGEEKEKRGSVWGLDFEIRNREIDQRHPVRLPLDSSPVFPLLYHYREILYCLFVRFASLFSTPLSFSTFLLAFPFLYLYLSLSLHRISHSLSAPESCLQIRATGFPTFLAHPKDEHPPTLGHIHPSPKLPLRRLNVLFFYACLFRRQRSPR